MTVKIVVGDCRAVLAAMDAESVDAVVTDPPYELAFMGKGWDSAGVSFDPETWRAAHRVLKPGGHLLAFGGTRTFHRIAVAIEDAGFEVKDCLCWLQGQGFPKHKSLLKPAWEPVVMAAKAGPRVVNVDACRIPCQDKTPFPKAGYGRHDTDAAYQFAGDPKFRTIGPDSNPNGRWPANVALDECASDALGEPSRFFYVAKASRSERNAGLEGMPERISGGMAGTADLSLLTGSGNVRNKIAANHHPTVKPVALMRWLVRLVTPPGGLVLDPFMGSGTTGIASVHEGLRFVGIEQDAEYAEIARRRISHAESILT